MKDVNNLKILYTIYINILTIYTEESILTY